MKQVIPLACPAAGFGGTFTCPFSPTPLSWAASGTFGEDTASVVIAAPGTLTNLFVYAPTASQAHPTFSIAVRVNNVDTALVATCPSSADSGQNVGSPVAVVAGDLVSYHYLGPIDPGFHCYCVVEFDASTANLSIYGVNQGGGSWDPDNYGIGGLLCNGSGQRGTSGPPTPSDSLSNSYSIASATGTLTTLALKSLRGVLGAVTATAYVRLNQVLQDGTGGTVDTAAVLTGGSDTLAQSTFSLPIVAGDHVEYVILVTGGALGFDAVGFTVGCAFVSAADGAFILCGGGNNNASSTVVPNYTFNGTDQADSELETRTPVGVIGLTLNGLYAEHTLAGGSAGKGWQDTVLLNGSATAATVSILDPATSGLILTPVAYAAGDFINLQYTPVNTPQGAQFHWGLAMSAASEPPPPAPETFVLRRLRQFMLPYMSTNYWKFIQRLEFICQAGVGLSSGQGSDPVIMVQISRDGGSTWGPETWLPLGQQGQYTRRAILRRGGRYRDGVVRVTCSDPVFAELIGCDGEITGGVS